MQLVHYLSFPLLFTSTFIHPALIAPCHLLFSTRLFVCILITKLPILRQQRGTRCPYKVRSHPEVVTNWDAVSLSYKMPARSGRRKVRSPSNPPLERSQAELNKNMLFCTLLHKDFKKKKSLQKTSCI